MTRVLVAYSSKTQSTAEIAEAIADELRLSGLDATAEDVDAHPRVAGFDAVLLGSALYVFRWGGSAIRFGRHNAAALRRVPVWMFSSGPFDRSAEERDIPPVRSVRKLMVRVGARGHRTFGGRAMAPQIRAELENKGKETDFRNFMQIRAWAREVADELGSALNGGRAAARGGAHA